MFNNKITKSIYLKTSAICLLLIAMLALWFWQERVLFCDMAYHSYCIIKDETFAIQAHRFGAALSQIPLLVSIKMGMPLEVALPIYSVSFFVVYFFIALVLWYILKTPYLVLSIPVLLTAIGSSFFYWCISELQQGMIFSLLLWGFIEVAEQRKIPPIIRLLIEIPLLVTAIFFHPIMIILVAFIYAFLYASKRLKSLRTLILSAVAIVTIYLVKYHMQLENLYDVQRMSGLQNLVTLFPNYFDTIAFKDFLKQCIHDYYIAVVFFIVISIFYCANFYWTRLLLVWSFTLGYVVLITVTDANLKTSFFSQNLHHVTAFFIVVPFMVDVAPRFNANGLCTVIVLIVLIRSNVIFHKHSFFTDKLIETKMLVDDTRAMNCNKGMIQFYNIKNSAGGVIWGIPYETIIISSLDGGENVSVSAIDNTIEAEFTSPNNEKIIIPFGGYLYITDLNNKYFHFKKGGYCKIK
jgi:hypothetical protein